MTEPLLDVRLAALEAGGELPTRYWVWLSEAERARADRFRRTSDRVQFVAARGLLHDALRERFGVTGARLVATGGAKPVLVGEGVPAGLDVNLSHADGLAACVLGIGARVGMDVECRDRSVDAAGIAAAYFAAEEQHATDPAGFLRLWTLKEAVAKAAGLGLALPLADFACAADPPRLLRAPAALGALAAWRLHAWDEPAHLVAVAAHWHHSPASDPGARWVTPTRVMVAPSCSVNTVLPPTACCCTPVS